MTTEETDPTDIEPLSSSGYTPDFDIHNSQCQGQTYPSTSSSSDPADVLVDCYDTDIDMDLLLANISHGKPFPTWFFNRLTPIEVPSLPLDIDGTAY